MTSLLSRLVRLASVALIGILLWPATVLAAPSIKILLSEPAGIYQEAGNSLVRELYQTPGNWIIQTSTPDQHFENNSDLTVAVGTKALRTALDAPGNKPVLALLVPRVTYEQLVSGNRPVSALYLDQPIDRQLQLLNLALPGLKKIGAPLGPYSRGFHSPLQSAAKESGLEVNSAVISESRNLLPALSSLAEDSQAFLLLPDPIVAERSSLHNFFLHTYRLRRPVLAYSAPLVQSGALLGLYATPAQLGAEAASWIGGSWGQGVFRLGPPRYPKRFTIGINQTVARSLDIALPGEETLSRQLEAAQ
jgi:ABC-type uncharacterized transport system substrate-binding protein